MEPRGAVRLLAGVALAVPMAAGAADVDVFQPAGSLVTGRGGLQGEAPTLGVTGFSGGVLGALADDPVVRRGADGSVSAAVDVLVPITLQGSWTQGRLLRIDLQMPVYAQVDAPLAGFAGPAVGDLRLQALIPLVGGDDEGFGFGLVPRVDVPTGSTEALVSSGLAAGLVATAGGRVGRLGWVGNAGVHLSGNDPLEEGAPGFGSRAVALAGAWWHVSDAVRFGAEADLGVGLAPGDGGTNNTSMAHGFAQAMLPSGLGFTLGGGTGLVAGLGIPRYRVFGAVTWTTLRRDQDEDGIVDADDACPTEAEDLDAFEDLDGCPELDNDGDTLADGSDLCPNQAEDLDGFEDSDGCLDDDNDQDGIVDVSDQCPDQVGAPSAMGCPDLDADGIPDPADRCPADFGTTALAGCADTDGDGIPDPDDACPDEPRPVDEDPEASDGCPQPAFVVGAELKIDQRVEFDDGKARIQEGSLSALDDVVAALIDAPYIRSLEIQGHTDNVGPADYNRRLSQSRASAVADYLVSKGVARERLVPQGYGETTPLFTNRTAMGREANRRVQFVVLEVEARRAPAESADAAD